MVGPSKLASSRTAFLDAVLAQGELRPTHAELAKVMGCAPRTVDNLLAPLKSARLVSTAPLRLGGGWGVVLSVAIGAESCRAGLVDANGEVRVKEELPLVENQQRLEPEALLDRIEQAVQKVLTSEQLANHPDLVDDGKVPLIGVATTWPFPVRGSKAPAGREAHPAWTGPGGTTLPAAVAKRLRIPVEFCHALRDGSAHALAVAFDTARARGAEPDDAGLHAGRISLVVRVGGGVSAGTAVLAPHRRAAFSFSDSTLIGGARSLAGELGHLKVSESIVEKINKGIGWYEGLAPLSNRWPCSCGEEGHLASMVGGQGFFKRMEESGVEFAKPADSNGQLLSRTAQVVAAQDNALVGRALGDMGRLIGHALASSVLMLDPHKITLTGSFAMEPVLAGVQEERAVWRDLFGGAPELELAGDRDHHRYIGVRGAALAVLRAKIYRQLAVAGSDPAGYRPNLVRL